MSSEAAAILAELRTGIDRLTAFRAASGGPDWTTAAVLRGHLRLVASQVARAGRRDLAERLVGIAAGAGAPGGLDAAGVVADIAERVATVAE